MELITSTLTPTGRLDEDSFAQLEASRLAGVPLAAHDLATTIHRRTIFAAVGEVLAEEEAAAHAPGSGSLRALAAVARRKKAASLSLAERAELVLRQLPAAGLALPAEPPPGTPAWKGVAEDDVGAAVRALWGRLRPAWSDYGADEWAAAEDDGDGADDDDGDDVDDVHDARVRRARAIFWAQRAEVVPTAAELETLWVELCRHISPPWPQAEDPPPPPPAAAPAPAPAAEGEEGEEGGDNRDPAKVAAEAAAAAAAAELAAWEAEERSRRHGWLNYDDFTRALAAALPFPSKREAVGGARLFLSLHLDAYGRARATSLHRAACTVAQLLSTRIDLAALDPGNTGRLDEPALESFVQACVPKIRRLAGHSHLRPGHSFEPFYVAHCTRKLLLALGGRRRCGWVSVEELLLSPQLSDLFSLCAADDNGDGDGAAAESALEEGCWFSLQRAIKVYRKFLELDGDHDGMLTSDELLQFGEEGMALTPAFCERLFEVVHTYDGRLDYKGYAAPLAWLRSE